MILGRIGPAMVNITIPHSSIAESSNFFIMSIVSVTGCLAFREFSSLRTHFQALRIITSRYCVVKVLSVPYLVPRLLLVTIRK